MLGVYEPNAVELLQEVFIWARDELLNGNRACAVTRLAIAPIRLVSTSTAAYARAICHASKRRLP
jgi:hypothetical protein